MARPIWLGVAVAVIVSVTLPAEASVVVGFDDLATPYNDGGQLWGTVPTTYANLTWNAWEVANNATYKSTYGNTSSGSGANMAYNKSGTMLVTTTSGAAFDFLSARVGTWAWHDGFASFSAHTLTVTGYLGSTVVGSVTATLASTGLTLLTANLTGVDRVEFSTPSVGWWVLDDFTYEPNSSGGGGLGAVPEPISAVVWGLGGLAFGGVVTLARRRASRT